MALSIYAYRRCMPTQVEIDEDGECITPRTVNPYVDPEHAMQADDIVGDSWYGYEERISHDAGSYGSYGEFRRRLACVGGYTVEEAWEGQAAGMPFVDLVNFADNEGTIGPRTAAKLAADFATHEAAAERVMSSMEMRHYRGWRAAFEMAADQGMVAFR